jgi:heme/copper-type cytochrome/quinol oxidase subunit 2
METLELIINALKWAGIFFAVIIIIYIILGIIMWLFFFLPEDIRYYRKEKKSKKEKELIQTIRDEIHYQMRTEYSIEKKPK